MVKTIEEIQVTYSDGSYFRIQKGGIQEIEDLQQAMSFLERAKQVFEQLRPIMSKYFSGKG